MTSTITSPSIRLFSGWPLILIGIVVLAMAWVLIRRLSGWALGLHLVLFEYGFPRRSRFCRKRDPADGGQTRAPQNRTDPVAGHSRCHCSVPSPLLQGSCLRWCHLQEGGNLRFALMLSLIVAGVWSLAGPGAGCFGAGCAGGAAGWVLRVPDQRVLPHPEPNELRRPVYVTVGVAAVAVLIGLWLGQGLLERVQAPDHADVIAHRGAAASRPENTMASVLMAIEDKADWVEIDVQETADDVVIIAHDSDFMKLAGVPLKVWDATMEDVAEIDIGSWFDPEFAGERAPTLHDVLSAAKGKSKVIIELKYYGHDVDLENRVSRQSSKNWGCRTTSPQCR